MPKTRERRSLNDRVRNAGVTSWALIGVALLIYGIWNYLFEPLAVIVAPLAIAIVIVYILNPLVTLLERRGLRRGLAVLVVFLLFLGVIGTALSFLVPVIGDQITSFIEDIPRLAEKFEAEANQFAAKRGWEGRVKLSSDDIQTYLEDNREQIFRVLGGVRSFAGRVVHLVITLVIGLVLSVYLLIDLKKIKKGFVTAVPPDYRDEVKSVMDKIGSALGGFFRGQLFVALFVGVASAIGLTLVKLPFAIVIGLIAGIFNLVPLIGPFIGAIPAVAIGLLSEDPKRALWAAVVLLIVQQIDNHVISPNVMGRTVRLHPVTVMLALLVGGTIAGIPGMLLVIPLVATIKIIAAHLWEQREELGVPDHIAEAGSPS